MSIEVRKLDDGATVVDLGAKWFRVHPDGTVVAKEAVQLPGEDYATVRRRPATWRERALVRKAIARAERGRA